MKTITVTSFQAAVHAGNVTPLNVEALRFSVPYLIAAMLLRGDINLTTLSDDLLHDPQLPGLAAKVELIFSPEYEKLRPGNNPAKVTIGLTDGKRFSHEIMNCLGDPRNPLPKKDICDKFMTLAATVIGQKRSGDFLKRVVQIEQEADIRPLMALLRPES